LAGGVERTASGFFGAALDAGGTDGRVELNGPAVAGEALSVSLWLRADDFQVFDARLIARAASAEPDHAVWEIGTVGPRLQARLRSVTGTTVLTAVGVTLERSVWSHALLIYDGMRLTLYQDGRSVRSTSKSGPIADDPAAAVWIGNRPGGGKAFDGRIDDVRVYQRAIGLAEIQALITNPALDPPECGDGIVQAGEDCDDANPTDHDGCDTTCLTSQVLEIDLGPFPGQITLVWTGGRPDFRVHRAADPARVDESQSVIAETPTAVWTETPPPGTLFYYRVRSRP
jgi:cysteine-rich repeat protein